MAEDTETRVIVGNIEVKRCEGGYGHFDAHTGELIDKRRVWTWHTAALNAAKWIKLKEGLDW
jgi:hypothetical protein